MLGIHFAADHKGRPHRAGRPHIENGRAMLALLPKNGRAMLALLPKDGRAMLALLQSRAIRACHARKRAWALSSAFAGTRCFAISSAKRTSGRSATPLGPLAR